MEMKSLNDIRDTLIEHGFDASVSELAEGASAVFVSFGIEHDEVQIMTARELAESQQSVTRHEVIFIANREQSALV